MSYTKKQLLELLHKEELSLAEKQRLYNYLKDSNQHELIELLRTEFNAEIDDQETADPEFSERVLSRIHNQIGLKTIRNKPTIAYMWLKRLSVAASVVGILSAGYYLFLNNKATNPKQKAYAGHVFKNDVAPGTNKALLVLANGEKIELDNAKNGTISSQGNTKVIKLNGKLSYNALNDSNAKIVYNTIVTPKGGRYQVELPDGSQVWLNAASSLRFPTAFAGKERRVEITGEAYFEVAKNKYMPFIVKVNNSEVRVLGTHFNVNAYSDEATVKTTLLEGSVQFTNGSSMCMLKPGEQSELSRNGQVKVIADADIESVVAWKNGLLHFENEDIKTVMRQLSRWYDIDVVYHKTVDDHFFAEIPSKANLSEVLKALELTGKVGFDIEGRTIVVN